MLKHNDTCINCKMSGYTNDILSKYNKDNLYESCWCDKIGGKVWWYSNGGCEDLYVLNKGDYLKNKPKRKKYKMNHYERKQITKKKLVKLSKINRYRTFVYFNEKENRYIKYYLSGSKNYAKYCSKRKVRNSKDFSLKGAGYRKVYDYWWCIY